MPRDEVRVVFVHVHHREVEFRTVSRGVHREGLQRVKGLFQGLSSTPRLQVVLAMVGVKSRLLACRIIVVLADACGVPIALEAGVATTDPEPFQALAVILINVLEAWAQTLVQFSGRRGP